MRCPPKIIGLIQAGAVTAYVSAFAFIAHKTQEWVLAHLEKPNVVFGIILFLLSFVTSALICGAIVLTYPAMAFFEGKRKEALKTILWSAVWLIIFVAIVATAGLLLLIRK